MSQSIKDRNHIWLLSESEYKKEERVDLTDEFVNHPKHYHKETGFEVIDVIEAWNLNFSLGNAVKYISRAGYKDRDKSEEDLQKAIWYILRHLGKEDKYKDLF